MGSVRPQRLGWTVLPHFTKPPQEESPEKAISGWDNETALKAAAGSFDSWGRSFCSAHRVGTFCDQFTQVRCCKASWGGFVKCGSTVHSSRCGWTWGVGTGGGAGWVIHAGWRQSSFCQAHRVGFFCSSHRKIQCCNDHGHYVECTTSVQRRYRC